MARIIDPRRRCLDLIDWPEPDRRLWQAAMGSRRGRFSARGLAARLAPASLEKALEGYGRWLGFLDYLGWLDREVGPLERLNEDRAAAYFDELVALGNGDYTIVGRFQELQMALRIMEPKAQVAWLSRPGGVPLRQRLAMEKRSFGVHHSATFYAWGFDLLERAVTLPGPRRRQVMLRDGLMIALLAAAGPRLSSVQVMRLGQQIRFDGVEWWMTLDVPDIKTDKPHRVPLPTSLTPWFQRYLEVERRELLDGQVSDAVWINWGGETLGEAGIEKRIRWWSTKRFGAENAFGVHRFRHCIGTTAPLMAPNAPGIGAALLGISGRVHEKHYDRGKRAAAGETYLVGLDEDRAEARAYLRRLADEHPTPEDAPKDGHGVKRKPEAEQ
ncbi:tyrosine-type recombinase/integrase [Belnapia sp. T18]|uniref:Tyrosine-type recombinase/integrase n=1 Tax=Belnapia arida TaxID=2804533 RepID=A0ABS1UCK2_9PROT|nr:tyrosine-type recombinase/integrase [Belnapia arida]MBL6082413.1 tyrosine-type recombinase/integrase [Belnapia arida]